MPSPHYYHRPKLRVWTGLKKSAPAGIRVTVGYQSAYSPNANVPAVAIVGFSTAKPCEVAREGFVRWLLDETTKDERYTVSATSLSHSEHLGSCEWSFEFFDQCPSPACYCWVKWEDDCPKSR